VKDDSFVLLPVIIADRALLLHANLLLADTRQGSARVPHFYRKKLAPYGYLMYRFS
jgi:hypothetical protein